MIIQNNKVRVFDNSGKTNDRFTITINNSVYTMNDRPFNPHNGFSQYSGEINVGYKWNENWGTELHEISELPTDTVKAIIDRF